MPQFNITTFASQLFWLVANMAVLYLMLAYVILPRISRMLEERKVAVQNDLQAARTMLEEAETTKLGYEQNLARIRSEAAAKMQEAMQAIESKLFEQERQLTKQLAEQARTEDLRLQGIRETLLEQNRTLAKTVTVQVLGQVLTHYFPTEKVLEKKLEQEVDRVLDELFTASEILS